MINPFPGKALKYFSIFLSSILFLSCGDNLPLKRNIESSFSLINQDSSGVIFPDNFKGKIILISYIYTNCPDICPLTTNNLRNIEKGIKKDYANEVQFLELSFDPERDTPSELKKYAESRNINEKSFQFLTGEKETIDSLLKIMKVHAIPADTVKFENGTFTYSFIHTDRITLIDKQGRIRNEYKGSLAPTKQILDDINSLE